MTYSIEFDASAAKELKKLDNDSRVMIIKYLKDKVAQSTHPKDLGKAMKYGYLGLWRYRVGKYRMICNIENDKLVVLVLRISIRDRVYEKGEI